MQVSELRATVNQGLLDFAWRQWSQIGVSASVTGNDQWAMDPEALILFTLATARQDPRLFDEVLDWVALNQKLLSIQRLRNLTSKFPVEASLVAAVVAWTKGSAPTDTLVSQEHADQASQRVFRPEVAGFVARADPVFADYGFLRPVAARSGKSREPDTARPVNFAFRLRQLFGPGSRSEVMRVLLTYADGALDAARIADEAGFAKRNVNEALTVLTASGAVSARWAGNERHFRARPQQWVSLLELDGLPTFVSWVHLLPAALEISMWLDEKATAAESGYLLSSQARTLLDLVGRDLETAGVSISRRPSADNAGYLPAVAAVSGNVLAVLAASPSGTSASSQ
jgi:hypothetical protein